MPLGDLDGGSFTSQAFGVSADGSVIAGFGGTDLGPEAFRWTQNTGMVGLGDLPGGEFNSQGIAISAGAACSSGKVKPSHVLEAMGYTNQDTIRVSLGWNATHADIKAFTHTWKSIYKHHNNTHKMKENRI